MFRRRAMGIRDRPISPRALAEPVCGYESREGQVSPSLDQDAHQARAIAPPTSASASYAISLLVVGMALRYRATAALAKGGTMARFSQWVIAIVIWHVYTARA